jgi:chromosome segregation ATPase
MDPGTLELVATAVAGGLTGIGAFYFRMQSKDKKANILTRRTLRKLGLDHQDKNNITIFTLNDDRRVAKAEEIYESVSQAVNDTKSEHDESSDNIKDLLKDLERVRQSIEKCTTEGDREILVATDLTSKLKEIGTEMMNFSTTLDLYQRKLKARMFWNVVRKGEGRDIVIDAMTKREGSITPDDTRLKEILKSAQKTLELGQSNYDKAVEKYVERKP